MDESNLLDKPWSFIIIPHLYGIQQSDNDFLEHSENKEISKKKKKASSKPQ